MTRPVVLLLAALALPACIAPSVLSKDERAVQTTAVEREWRAPLAGDLQGLFGSSEITGPAAAALRKVWYWFEPDGKYTGAALFAESPPRFEVLSGTWSLVDDRLQLDDADPATLEAADDALRLTGAEGTVVLVREELH